MKKLIYLIFFFLILNPFLGISQVATPKNNAEIVIQNVNDSLTYQLYKLIALNASSKPDYVIQSMGKLITDGANPNGLLILNEKVRKLGTYIPIVKEFYTHKYRKCILKTSPFHKAVASGNIRIVQKMIYLGAKVDIALEKNNYPITKACSVGNAKMIFFLLEKGADINHVDLSNLDNIIDIEKLVRLGADVTTVNWDFFLNNSESLKRLIALNPDFRGVSLDFERIFNNHDLLDFLLNNGMPQNVEGKGLFRCPLFFGAVKYNDLYALKRINDKFHVDLNSECSSNFSRTALTIAIENEYIDIIRYLLANGADPMQKDWTGKISINQAIGAKNAEKIMKLLIDAGADIEYSGYFGETPLMHAIKLDYYISTIALINLGANVNFKSKRGKTPLLKAIEADNLPVITLLVKHGADTKAKINGKSIVEFAKEKGAAPAVINYLESLK